MKLTFSKQSKSPETLGLPILKIKSMGATVYYPRFYSTANELLVEFGHYWGFGAYYVDTIMEVKNDLNLCGFDESLDSIIEFKEINKLIKYVNKYEDKLNKISKVNFTKEELVNGNVQ